MLKGISRVALVVILIAAVQGMVSGDSDIALTRLRLAGITPVACDWNGDGCVDLVVSTPLGLVYVLETEAGLANPRFSAIQALEAVDGSAEDASAIRHEWSWISPRFDVVDWNLDGLLDLIIADPSLHHYVYLGQEEAAFDVLQPAGILRFVDGTPLSFPSCGSSHRQPSAIRIVDWNLDGTRDVVLAYNEVFYFRNQGSDVDPQFTRPSKWESGFWCADNGSFAEYELFGLSGSELTPNVVDWNGDGRLDLVIGLRSNLPLELDIASPVTRRATGFVMYKQNRGTNAAPDFRNEGEERHPYSQFLQADTPGDYITTGTRSSAHVADVNEDGLPDLLVAGDNSLCLYLRQEDGDLCLAWELLEACTE